MQALITGEGGFIGSRLALRLLELGAWSDPTAGGGISTRSRCSMLPQAKRRAARRQDRGQHDEPPFYDAWEPVTRSCANPASVVG
jgi:nucleoside-diphosphate-sugar epimerase